LFNLDGFNGIFTLMKSTGGFSFVNDNVRIVRTSNVMQLFSWVGHYFYNAADVASGNMINFVTGTNAELTDTNAEQSFFYIEPKIKQTLTGAYNGLKINVIERGVGDGSTGDGNNLLNVALDGVSKFVINNSGSVGIGTTSPANPLAVNRHEDGIIVDFESEDTIEGNISIADATTSYNAFVGSHYTQLKHRQHELPIGSVVISTGEIIPCSISCQKFTRVPINEATTIIPKANAIEIKEIEVEDKDNIISTDITYTYDPETDTETSSSIYTYGTKIVQKKQLKRGIIFNGKSRNFYTINSGYVKRDNKFYIEETIIRHKPNKEYFVYVDTTNIESDLALSESTLRRARRLTFFGRDML